jgi:hypothetical protein
MANVETSKTTVFASLSKEDLLKVNVSELSPAEISRWSKALAAFNSTKKESTKDDKQKLSEILKQEKSLEINLRCDNPLYTAKTDAEKERAKIDKIPRQLYCTITDDDVLKNVSTLISNYINGISSKVEAIKAEVKK